MALRPPALSCRYLILHLDLTSKSFDRDWQTHYKMCARHVSKEEACAGNVMLALSLPGLVANMYKYKYSSEERLGQDAHKTDRSWWDRPLKGRTWRCDQAAPPIPSHQSRHRESWGNGGERMLLDHCLEGYSGVMDSRDTYKVRENAMLSTQ